MSKSQILLQPMWSAKVQCPVCGQPIVWSIPNAEYREIEETVRETPGGHSWVADVSCGPCGNGLVVQLTPRTLGMEIRVLTYDAELAVS